MGSDEADTAHLQAAGFEIRKVPGYGRKRECLRGTLSSAEIRAERAAGSGEPSRAFAAVINS